MRAGELDSLVVFQKPTDGDEDAFGETVSGWTEHAKAWAKVLYGRGEERRTAAIEGADQPATFLVRATARTRVLTVKDRILYAGSTWDITNVAPIGRVRVELTAKRRA